MPGTTGDASGMFDGTFVLQPDGTLERSPGMKPADYTTIVVTAPPTEQRLAEIERKLDLVLRLLEAQTPRSVRLRTSGSDPTR